MSLEEGARKQKAIIERKIRQVAVNTSRLRSYTSSLEKRKAKVDKSIDQATKELDRVVNSCINSIRQHEASGTEVLTVQKSIYDDTFAKQLSKLTEKIQGMDNLSAVTKDVLQRNNLQEMLNVTHVLDERISREEETPWLNYPELKYIPNDELSLNLAPGMLFATNTEPSLSVATGEGLTKGTIGEEGSFTVLTKDSRGQTTYSEIDKVNVEMKSRHQGIADIQSVVRDLKYGRYSIFYRPNDAGEFSVSIKIREEPIKESPFKLMVTKKAVINGTKKTNGFQPPHYWDPQPQDTEVHLVELKPFTHAQEYKKVSNLFRGTCSSNILKIERIQNPTLYGFYAIQQQKMDEANGLGSNEMLLFHGTAETNCRAINRKGFNRSYCWQKNNLYGKGVYFAETADYSARSQFSPPGFTGLRHMYLARVLVGEYTVGKPDIIVPPPKSKADPTDTFDSVVDQIPNPGIFVVFHDSQCYPEYLITFQ